MKKNLLLVLTIIVSFFVSACSCDKFDISTYESAVKKFENSIGFSYDLTITTYTEGKNIYLLEEGTHKYRLTPNRIVENFLSEIKQYEISSDSFSGDGVPQKVYELNRYYIGEEGKFYIKDIDRKYDPETITYEEKYNEDSIYNINNIIPTFGKDFISEFSIVKDEQRKGYSIATFKASCPAKVKCTSDQVTYKVTIDRDFYFSSIEFTYNNIIEEVAINNGVAETVELTQTISYKYEFDKYNSEVEITFPNDLDNY